MEKNTVPRIVASATNPPPLSLRSYCVIKVTTQILERREINALLKQCNCVGRFVERSKIFPKKEWFLLQTKVSELITEAGIPSTLRERILDGLWLLTCQKLRWMRAYASNLEWEHLQDFTWTDRGKIDGHKTVKTLIRSSFFTIEQRFQLACVFFLVDESRQLWQEMTGGQKASFFADEAKAIVKYLLPVIQETGETERQVLTYKDIFENKLPWEAFKYYAEDKKLFSTGYFEYLSDRLKSYLFYEEEVTYTCLYLLSQLDDETKTLFFYHHPALLLGCFVDYLSASDLSSFYRRHVDEIEQEQTRILLTFLFLKFNGGGKCHFISGKFFLNIFVRMPYESKMYIRNAGYGMFCGAVLIKTHFPLVLRKGGNLEMERFISEQLESNAPGRMLEFKRSMWTMLKVLIRLGLIPEGIMEHHKIFVLQLFGLCATDTDGWESAMSFIRETTRKIFK